MVCGSGVCGSRMCGSEGKERGRREGRGIGLCVVFLWRRRRKGGGQACVFGLMYSHVFVKKKVEILNVFLIFASGDC